MGLISVIRSFELNLLGILAVIEVQRITIDSVGGVVHPDLTDGGEFQQTLLNHGRVVALITQVEEIHLP